MLTRRSALAIGIVYLALLFVRPSFANDAAAAIAAGGIQFRKEMNVSLEKENLYISRDKVTVSYTFKNNSRGAATTQVAFPIPSFQYSPVYKNEPAFTNFSVEVNGRPVRFESEIKALVKGTDVTEVLQKHKIPIRDFEAAMVRIGQLDEETRNALAASGVIGLFGAHDPAWSVHMLYHWEQTFPANSLTRIKHSYKPDKGYRYVYFYQSSTPSSLLSGDSFYRIPCLDKSAENWLQGQKPSSSDSTTTVFIEWVRYILITANTWQGPIKDFTLTVQSPSSGVVIPCTDEIDTPHHFKVHRKNYRPEKDLIVFFLYTDN